MDGEGDADVGDLLYGGSGDDEIHMTDEDSAYGGSGADSFCLDTIDDGTTLDGTTLDGGTVVDETVIWDRHGQAFDSETENDLLLGTNLETGSFTYV